MGDDGDQFHLQQNEVVDADLSESHTFANAEELVVAIAAAFESLLP